MDDDVEQTEPDNMEEQDLHLLKNDLEYLNALKLDKARIEQAIEEAQAGLVKEMNAMRMKELAFTDPTGKPVKATVVTGTQRSVDIELLVEIDKALADAVCDMKVNMTKVKKAESLGLFSQPKFKAVFSEKPKRPYILFSTPEETSSE